MYSSKTSWEYILLSSSERKMAFLAIFKPTSAGNRPFFGAVLVYIGWLGAYLNPLTPSTTTLCKALPPPIVSAPSSF
jgi:hypothetical protein